MNSDTMLPPSSGELSQPVASDSASGLGTALSIAPSPNADGVKKPVGNPGASTGAHPVRVLVVEDDVPLARLLSAWLTGLAYVVETAHDGEAADGLVSTGRFGLVLMDLNLPKMDGLTLLSQIHARMPELPVLVLTGRNRTEDRVITLNHGADDCLVKPFSLLELQARIGAVLRRRGQTPAKPMPLQAGLSLNREEYRVERDGRRIELTPREFALLEFLMEQAPKPVSRATLMEQVWRVPFDPSTNIVDVYMKYLRDKIDSTGEEKLIRTVRGVGYALACA